MFRRGGGSGLRIPLGGGGFSFGTIILIGVVCLMLGINPLTLLTGGGLEIPNMPRPDRQGGPQNVPGLPGQGGVADDNDYKAQFVRQVLADTEDVWDQIFKGAGRQYRKAQARAVQGRHAHCVRHGSVGDGAVLLSGGQESVHRPCVL